MSNNSRDGNENFWQANQHPPPHLYAHAQHQQQLHQPLLQQPVPQLLPHPQHLSYAVSAVPVVQPSAAPFYHNGAGMVDTFGNTGNGFSMLHGTHQQMNEEYTDPYGQPIKLVYQTPQHQSTLTGMVTGMACPQEETLQTPSAQDKQGYELFSNNNSFVLAAPGFGFTLHNSQQQHHQQQQQQRMAQPQETQQQQLSQHQSQQSQHQFSSTPLAAAQPVVTHAVHSAPVQSTPTMENGNSSTSASSLISQLVGNWAPTISGTYGNGPASMVNDVSMHSSSPRKENSISSVSPTKASTQKAVINPVPPTMAGNISQANVSSPSSPGVILANKNVNVSSPSAAAVYNQQNDDNSAKLDQNVNKKQRIVAEVKPMRMSYSDVLSKNVPSGSGSVANVSNAMSTTMINGELGNVLPATAGTKSSLANGSNGGTKSKRENKRSNSGLERKSTGNNSYQKDRIVDGSSKKGDRSNGSGTGSISPVLTDGSIKMDVSIDTAIKTGQEKGRKSDKSGLKKDKIFRAGPEGADGNMVCKKAPFGQALDDEPEENAGLQNRDSTAAMINDETEEERGEDFDDYDSEEYEQDSVGSDITDQQNKPANDGGGSEELPFVYNVKKNTGSSNVTHFEKINPSRTSAVHRKGARSVGPRSSGKQLDKSVNSPAGSKRSVRSRKNQKYAFLEKLLFKWVEFNVLALNWLWSLVSDVVYLSVRLAWDYLLSGYQYCWQHVCTMRQDFSKNSGRPGVWFRDLCQSFDNRFAKDSRWAFWRRCRRQTPLDTPESKTSHYRDGRLPSTADEAMSSLLNCKGKDAYSILGVSPDCSQEQIRKHYKKIAVLVHPDKNKQPGAEEAFKVLQRSFELIGEPESRKEYDQSLAEALNAEKAWSEINDLLTQLHTKISEAANTIRCSSCCLRHPRKPTGRAHYAARECSSCKIRHPAREGDIWAETSFLGLRWKYLAMMEGNVYDITEWANCQKGALSHLQPNSHIVQYRIVLGSSSQQQQQQQQQPQQQQGQPQDKEQLGRSRKEAAANEPNLDDFLNNIYAGQNQQTSSQNASSKRRFRRN
ncbi:uncharacterized protein LOC128731373 [Anopheles nili]|uniref:uncharacterized protein LOC128731373 n=1 Tax=Anopheles nili TaxID=185578 RepID=UPI00237AAE26|nr:uncharacterized protein LOC128731373 [Anopheles nili]